MHNINNGFIQKDIVDNNDKHIKKNKYNLVYVNFGLSLKIWEHMYLHQIKNIDVDTWMYILLL